MSELRRESFADVDTADEFFGSLREDYPTFDEWFARKAAQGEEAYVFRREDSAVEGFLYLKVEDGYVDDVSPALPPARRLKIGTLKVVPHGTRLGERLVKKAFDHAIREGVEELYLTIFHKHAPLIDLLARYGFAMVAKKESRSGHVEDVLVRSLRETRGDIVSDYPLIKSLGTRKFVLSIYPQFHTRMLPDSKLNNEPPDIVADVSHANSIHKVYLTGMKGTDALRRGDILIIYRTNDGKGPAHYRSVVTSVCVIEEVRHLDSFAGQEELVKYCAPCSVFTEAELSDFWRTRKYPTVIQFTYNAALRKRVTRGDLIDGGVIDPGAYAGFMSLNDEQFERILELGGLDEGLVVHTT